MNESSNGRIQASAGRIKTHNLHLLVDDKSNQGNIMDQNRPQSAGSHSSEDSRQMDQSPTGNQSDDSLEAEMKYQEELKERLRASFADLGMNPEGVLVDSLDEGDLRDSLDEEPNQLQREGTFVKDDQDDPQFQDSLDATQESNNNEDFSLQDSLDGRPDKTTHHNQSNEPTSQEIEHYDKTIDNHMVTYPALDSTLQSVRQSSGDSQKSSGSKPSSRRNSRDSGNHSPKGTSGLVRLKDNPNLRKPPSGQRKDSGLDSYGNDEPPKPVTIPGINNFSRDTTPAEGTKRERTRPKLTKTDTKIHRLESGEEVRVEYISDESDDEDVHFVDEKGSPVDNYGLPLNDKQSTETQMQRQFRIKPAPPKEPSPREQQIVNARRTSSGKLSRIGNINRTEHVEEPIVTKTEAQQLGIKDNTLPPKENSVFGEVRISSNTSGGSVNSPHNSASKKRSNADISGGSGNSSGNNSASKKHSGPDPYNDLRFDIDAVKKAAAEQEAVLRLQSNSREKQRTYSPPNHVPDNRNNSGNTNENRPEQSVDSKRDQNIRQQQPQQQQSFVDNSSAEYQQNRRPDEINQFNPQNNSRNGQQSWQQNYNGHPPVLSQPQAGVAPTQPSPQHGIIQPIRSQAQPGGQYLQSPPAMQSGQFFNYQQQQPPQQFHQPLDGGYQQPMQFSTEPSYPQGFPPSQQYPVQSGFEPRLSHSYTQLDMVPSMQQSQQWPYQQQQAQGYQVQPQQQFQPVPQPQTMYTGQFLQGSGQFSQGFNPVMQQQQPQFVEQYDPNLAQQDVMGYPLPQNVPNQMNQHQYGPGPQMPLSQPMPAQRQVQSGPVYSRLPRQPPKQQPIRVGPDFVQRNKEYLRYGPPKKTYQQLYSEKKDPHTQDTHTQTPTLNPNTALPGISRENSQDVGVVPNTWADLDDETWTKQLVEEQKQMALLMRGQSDANLPLDATFNVRTSQASWSADHATAYARMQAQQQNLISPRTKVMFDDDMYNSFESEDLNLKSPRGQSNSHPNSKRTSPYPLLPGIQKKGQLFCLFVFLQLQFTLKVTLLHFNFYDNTL